MWRYYNVTNFPNETDGKRQTAALHLSFVSLRIIRVTRCSFLAPSFVLFQHEKERKEHSITWLKQFQELPRMTQCSAPSSLSLSWPQVPQSLWSTKMLWLLPLSLLLSNSCLLMTPLRSYRDCNLTQSKDLTICWTTSHVTTKYSSLVTWHKVKI